MAETVQWAEHGGIRLAMLRGDGRPPAVVWLGGLASDMTGSKAAAVAAWAGARGLAHLRFDYSGHGQSAGAYADGTITRWLGETLGMLRGCTAGPLVLVGSSLGGWLALLAAQAPDIAARLRGMVLIAPAWNLTEALIAPALTPEQRAALARDGALPRRSEGGSISITARLIADGGGHSLHGAIRVGCPVRILQGMADDSVPWAHAVALAERLAELDVRLTLVKDAGHRLSRPGDIALLLGLLAELGDSAVR